MTAPQYTTRQIALIAEALEHYKKVMIFQRDCIAASQDERQLAEMKLKTIDSILST